MIKKLKESLDKQRHELRAVKRENQQKNVDLEAVSINRNGEHIRTE